MGHLNATVSVKRQMINQLKIPKSVRTPPQKNLHIATNAKRFLFVMSQTESEAIGLEPHGWMGVGWKFCLRPQKSNQPKSVGSQENTPIHSRHNVMNKRCDELLKGIFELLQTVFLLARSSYFQEFLILNAKGPMTVSKPGLPLP